MSLQLLFEKFKQVVDRPESIKEIRSLILQLAVQGKLVEQDPNDESASVLLEKIKAEKERLVKEKKIKNEKPLPPIDPEDRLANIPDSWAYCRIGEGFVLNYGKALSKENRVQTGKVPVYGSNGVVGFHDHFLTDKPCIVIGRKGSAGAVNMAVESSWTTDVAYYVIPPEGFVLKFMHILFLQAGLENIGKGIKPGVNRNEAYIMVVGFPPLAEQHCIVEKVDQLMGLCDCLEDQLSQFDSVKTDLAESAVHHLMEAPTEQEFNRHWTFIRNRFDTLFDNPENVKKLKQAILQLAVQGKLVPQDPNDEPASVLLEKIKTEKQKLIKEGKIKKQKPLPPTVPGEVPFEVPEGWVWDCLSVLAIIGTGSTPTSTEEKYYDGTIPWATSSVTSLSLIFSTEKHVSELALLDFNLKVYNPGVLIIAMYGQGKTRGQISELGIASTINQACCAVDLITQMDFHRKYVKYFFKGEYEKIRLLAAGGAQPNLNVRKIQATKLPIPPLEEQHRIVEKVDQLMGLCDHLESDTGSRNKANSDLLQSLVHHVVEPALVQ